MALDESPKYWSPKIIRSDAVDAAQFDTTRFRLGYDEDQVDTLLDSIVEQLKAYEAFMEKYAPVIALVMSTYPENEPARTVFSNAIKKAGQIK